MKATEDKNAAAIWIEKWMQSVATNQYSMTQRKVSSIHKKSIDMKELIQQAKEYKVHLLLLKDDKGEELIAASKDEFKVLC